MGWRSLFALLNTAGLTTLTVWWAAAVLRGDTRPVAIAILLAMLGGALYFWRLLLAELLPRFTLELRFRRAWDESNWSSVKIELERAFARGWISDEWRSSLAFANQRLGRRKEAILLYDQIESALPTDELEFARIFNHSVCLLDLGRFQEARALFESVALADWPDPMHSHVEEHRRRLEAHRG